MVLLRDQQKVELKAAFIDYRECLVPFYLLNMNLLFYITIFLVTIAYKDGTIVIENRTENGTWEEKLFWENKPYLSFFDKTDVVLQNSVHSY